MIITISGAACTGKTTLLQTISSEIGHDKRVHYHGEFIRKVFSDYYSHKYADYEDLLAGDPVDIINIHKETARMFNEILWSSNLDEILVFDRCPLDASIYMYLNLEDKLINDNIIIMSKYREASKYIYRCSADFMNHNPIIFYVRPFTTNIEDDGFRPSSLLDRRSLELSLFDKEFLSLPGVHLLPSSLEERVHVMKYVINNHK